jgi:hypothetical protein
MNVFDGGAQFGREPRSRSVLPLVSLAVSVAALVLLVLVVATPWIRGKDDSRLPSVPPREPMPSVDLWVGDFGPGVKGVLSAVFNEPGPDREQDAVLNRRLDVPKERALAYYRILVFNVSEQTVTLRFEDGALTITPAGGAPLPLRSLSSLVASAPPAVAAVEAALGTMRETLVVPPGKRAVELVGFDRRVPLGEAASVARQDGTPFHMRRISRQRWIDLLEAPTMDDLKDL